MSIKNCTISSTLRDRCSSNGSSCSLYINATACSSMLVSASSSGNDLGEKLTSIPLGVTSCFEFRSNSSDAYNAHFCRRALCLANEEVDDRLSWSSIVEELDCEVSCARESL
jgi:hypothetical protein